LKQWKAISSIMCSLWVLTNDDLIKGNLAYRGAGKKLGSQLQYAFSQLANFSQNFDITPLFP
jgi:hypothetical protein